MLFIPGLPRAGARDEIMVIMSKWSVGRPQAGSFLSGRLALADAGQTGEAPAAGRAAACEVARVAGFWRRELARWGQAVRCSGATGGPR
jgi:hypothetical protein